MNFNMIPAPKRVKVFEGVFQFDALLASPEELSELEAALLKLKGNPLAEAYAAIARQAADHQQQKAQQSGQKKNIAFEG